MQLFSDAKDLDSKNGATSRLSCDVVAAPAVPDMILTWYRSTLSSSKCKRNVFCAVLIFF